MVITALTRNQVYRQRYRGFESHPLRQTTSIPIRGWMLFFCCGWDSKVGALATCRWHVATGVGESHPLRRLAASSGDGCRFFVVGGRGMRSLCPGGAKPAYAACSREPRKPGIRCHFDGQKACIHASFRRFRNYSHSLPSSLF